MDVDIDETREGFAALLDRGAGDEAALRQIRRLCRSVLLDTWRSVAMGDVARPAQWTEALRSLLIRAAPGPLRAPLNDLEQALAIAVSAMPRPIAASEGPRTDTERRILEVLAKATSPLTRGEIHGRISGDHGVTPQAVGQALERLAYRDLLVRRRETRQGAAQASVWQVSPAARGIAAAAVPSRKRVWSEAPFVAVTCAQLEGHRIVRELHGVRRTGAPIRQFKLRKGRLGAGVRLTARKSHPERGD